MPENITQEFVFRGVDAVSAPHALQDGFVQAATNIDFGFTPGAAQVRRGCSLFRSVGANPIKTVTRVYSNPSVIDNSPYYVADDSTVVTRLLGTTATAVASASGNYIPGIGAYKDHTYISLANVHVKDNGTNVTEWIKQAPGSAPTVTVGTSTLLPVVSTYTAVEGTISGTSTGTGAYIVTTASTDSVSNRLQLQGTPISTNLSTRGTAAIGDYGTDYLTISFSNPSVVTRVSRDFSIGDTTFSNYWHSEIDTTVTEVTVADPETLIEGLAVDGDTRTRLLETVRAITRVPQIRINWATDAPNKWSVPRSEFLFTGDDTTPLGWTNIGAVRIIVEATQPVDVTVTEWLVDGDEEHSLNDPEVGVTYWETWATLDTSGNVLGESAPSPASVATKIQHGYGIITSTATATGVAHGITHRLFYRQGGLLPDAYQVVVTPYGTASAVHDHVTDLTALIDNVPLERNIWSAGSWPGNVTDISDPYYNRLFFSYGNKLAWTLPNRPDVIPNNSHTIVSHEGDAIQKLIVWDRLIIINRDSVYEMAGDVFEGADSNWTLQRSGSHRGSIAYRTIIKTPQGIPLLNYDGLTMYYPGRGVDASIEWIDNQIADVFKGAEGYSPAALKGSRMPVAYRPYLFNSVAAYANDKLYLGIPTGTNTSPSTLFVLDFTTQKVWPYVYPFTFTSIYWDSVDNRLLLGSSDGKVMLAEVGLYDTQTNGTASTLIPWNIKTRAWTAPSDTVLENIMVEHAGIYGSLIAYYDGTTTSTLGTFGTNTNKEWFLSPLNGTIANNVVFEVSGTQGGGNSCAVYGMKFDALTEPPRVNFYRTEHTVKDTEHLWDVAYADIETIGTGTAHTGTVTAVVFVDNTAVKTASLTAPSSGRLRIPVTIPAETYGYVAYTTYTGVPFKHWTTLYDARPEPPRIDFYRTDMQGNGEENIVDGFDFELNPRGTVISIGYVDQTAVGTFTSTGTKRKIYNYSAPTETYGRLVYVTHTGTGFKHYRSWVHLRPEPDLITSYVSDREVSQNEWWWKGAMCDLDCRGNVVEQVAYVDGTAVMTSTLTGNGRSGYSNAYPSQTYGNVGHCLYTSTGRFKHYRTWYDREEEPDRLTFYATPVVALPTENYVKTWFPEINPINGTTTGVLYLNGTAVSTQTMTGNIRKVWEYGLPNTTVGKTVEARYSSSTPFKYYSDGKEFEYEPKPFSKTTWLVTYKKVGGATQLDMGRFYSIEVEGTSTSATSTVTSIWDIDGTAFATSTLTFTGRQYRDRISFPPGARGYLFQQRVSAATPIRVWKSNIDLDQIGVKGLSRRTFTGTPQ